MRPDVLFLNHVGPAGFDYDTPALGGSELEILQIAEQMAKRGHNVAIANGANEIYGQRGVDFVPRHLVSKAWPTKSLYLERMTKWTPEESLGSLPPRVIVRATDVYCAEYDVHRQMLVDGRAALVGVTRWHVDKSGAQGTGFSFAKETIVIPPMLDPTPETKRVPGRFVYASGPIKGLDATTRTWRNMFGRFHRERCLDGIELQIILPGWGYDRLLPGRGYDRLPTLTPEDAACHISIVGVPALNEYRRLIASAEGLFFVNAFTETFCCAAAFAERSGTRTHILCLNGFGGIPEAIVDHRLLTNNREQFFQQWRDARLNGFVADTRPVVDRSPEALAPAWEKALHLDRPVLQVGQTDSTVGADSTVSHADSTADSTVGADSTVVPTIPTTAPTSSEQQFPSDPTLATNQEPLGPYFGDFLSLLRASIAPGGSEFGLGLSLFSLAVSTRAANCLEIGRFKGFSTLALASACKLQDIGWKEPQLAEQRQGIDYTALTKATRRVISIDPFPTKEADELLERAGLTKYVQKIDAFSSAVEFRGPIDLLFIDGSHTLQGIRADVDRFVPWVRPGGYIVMHDYYGWFDAEGKNGSAIPVVIKEALGDFDKVLIDTSHASLVVLRKTRNLIEPVHVETPPQRVPPRADGRPTVGLVLIAKGDEASTVIARAIVSAKLLVDCTTVVCDGGPNVLEVCRALGAEVHIRPDAKADWETGRGVIAQARNAAIAIAEKRTDYLLVLDPDDTYEGSLPEKLELDAYEIMIHDGAMRYPRVSLFKSGTGARYEGIRHESLTFNGTSAPLPSLVYRRNFSTLGYQDQDPPKVKFAKHAKDLNKWLLDHPDDSRAAFYLARSYQDAGMLDEAIVAYEARIKLGGWLDECYYSAFQIGQIQGQKGIDPTSAYLRAHEFQSHRAEPLVCLAQWHRDEKQKHYATAYLFARQASALPLPVSGVFVNAHTYQWQALAEHAICAYWAQRLQESRELFGQVRERCPQSAKDWASNQIAMCTAAMGGK
jgi:tetratricopeptide (TPR) repeat protein